VRTVALPRVRVDFNELDSRGRLYTFPDDSDQELRLDREVVLWDDEGNSAQAHVVEITDRGRAIVEMTPGTWRGTPALPGARVSDPDLCYVVMSTDPLVHVWPSVVLHGLASRQLAFHCFLSSATGKAPKTAPEPEMIPEAMAHG
jgi:hypothetical protein